MNIDSKEEMKRYTLEELELAFTQHAEEMEERYKAEGITNEFNLPLAFLSMIDEIKGKK